MEIRYWGHGNHTIRNNISWRVECLNVYLDFDNTQRLLSLDGDENNHAWVTGNDILMVANNLPDEQAYKKSMIDLVKGNIDNKNDLEDFVFEVVGND